MKNISVFGFATFGHPNGFTQSVLYGDRRLENEVDTFDLKTDAILLLSPQDRIYSLRKERVKNESLYSYSVYTFAKEKNSDRSGTFIGTALVFTDEIPPENLTVNVLHQIHANLKNNNVSGQKELQVSQSKEFNIEGIIPDDFDKIAFQVRKPKDLNPESAKNSLVIYSAQLELTTIQNLFKKSLELIADYSTIYFIDSKEVAEFVQKRRIFKLISADGIEHEIKSLKEERSRRVQLVFSKIEKEKQKIIAEQNSFSSQIQKVITDQEKKQAENRIRFDDSIRNLKAAENGYQEYFLELEKLQLKLNVDSGYKPDGNLLSNAQKSFEQKKKSFKIPQILDSLNVQNMSRKETPIAAAELLNPQNKEHRKAETKPKLDAFKLVSAVLNVLFIAALVYLLFFYQTNLQPSKDFSEKTAAVQAKDSVSHQYVLNPVPNDSLTDKDYVLTSGKISAGISLDSVVSLIFLENAARVGQFYQFQKSDYGKALLQKNEASFRYNAKNEMIYTGKDSLKIIPAFKYK